MLVAVFGEIYFYPFRSELKFSAGVVVLGLILLLDEDISGIKLSLLCGLSVFMVRSMESLIFSSSGLWNIGMFNFPSFVYYVAFGILISIVDIKNYKDNIFRTIMLLSSVDVVSNIVESILRRNVNLYIVRLIILVAFVRSISAYIVYIAYNRQKLFILSREHQKRYTQLNLLMSSIQAEMFYLRKSMNDIEDVMKKSYSIYESYKEDKNLKESTLDIAREVHEIKKDYYRVLKGFESFVKELEGQEAMKLSHVFTIISDNTKRYLKESGKDIKIIFDLEEDVVLKSYYGLFTLLNNLIINSIDACGDGDYIRITEREAIDTIFFEVSDTGEGIEKDVIPYIFNPGFTTKYDSATGAPSTGIGLSHVKNIVEDLGGTVDVESKPGFGTDFKLIIPKKSIIKG